MIFQVFNFLEHEIVSDSGWMQGADQYGPLQFTKEQAQFLRFAECIRKYVLEVRSSLLSHDVLYWLIRVKSNHFKHFLILKMLEI